MNRIGSSKVRRTKASHGERDGEVQPVWLSEAEGVLQVRNPDLFRSGQEGFCRRLADALVHQEVVHSVEISLPAGTCRVEFTAGKVGSEEMSQRFARAVRSAVGSAAGDHHNGRSEAGWEVLTAFSADPRGCFWETMAAGHGSLRLRRKILRGDRDLARRIAEAIARTPGLDSSRVAFWSHDLNLTFDPASLSASTVVEAAEAALRQQLESATEADRGASEEDGSRGVVGGLKRIRYLVMAGGSFGMTLVGLLVPGIPTVPFLLATSYYLARSSPALDRRLKQSRFFGPILTEYENHGGLRPLSRVKLVGLTLTIGLSMLVIVGPPLLIVTIMAGAMATSVYFIMRIPGIPRRTKGRRAPVPALAG